MPSGPNSVPDTLKVETETLTLQLHGGAAVITVAMLLYLPVPTVYSPF